MIEALLSASPLTPPSTLVLVAFAPLFGLCVGSFLNVVVYRLPREHLSLSKPASHCFFCGTTLAWFENVPLLSWLALGGKCRHCRARISPIYPATELLMGLVFGLLVWTFLGRQLVFERFAADLRWPMWQQVGTLALYLTFASALAVSSMIDLRHRIIPDEISIGGTVLAPIAVALFPAALPRLTDQIANVHLAGLATSALGATVGITTLYGIGWAGKKMFGKEAMGLGDVKLMGLIGALLGWDGVLMTLFIACLLGSVVGILWLLIKGDHYLPFGPYLAMGALAVLLVRPQLLALLDALMRPPMRPPL